LPHNYKPLPPLWQLEELLELTDDHPSGLMWKESGKFVTRLHKQSGFYQLSIDNEVYVAHRIVYYLRTNKCPDHHAVKHHHYNKDKDNRKELTACYQVKNHARKPSWSWD
jgi:hypothetical protein